jgi:hypothetical protein
MGTFASTTPVPCAEGMRSGLICPRRVSRVLTMLAVGFIVVLTRWALAPQYLYYFDSVNFALALDEYNPALHQPQPPGYPLFVATTRLLHLIFPAAESTLLAAGVVASFAAIILLWRLGTEMFSRSAGVLAAALLLFNPVFWFGALTNQVRLYLAFGSIAVALLAWRSLQRQSAMWLYAAFAAVGVSSGFRPGIALVMMPLLLWIWWRTGATLLRLVFAGAALLITSAPWVMAVCVSVGGLQAWLGLIWQYANEQFGGSSAAFGAPLTAARLMARMAIVWNGLGALSWVWAVPFINWRDRDDVSRQRMIFIALWFFPVFGFSAAIHIGDPDQALASIPALCMIGGIVLARFLTRIQSSRLLPLAAGVAGVNAMLFFFPPKGLARATGYAAVVERDAENKRVIETIQQLQTDAPLVIAHFGATVTWRQLAYYFPRDYVIHAPTHGGADKYILFGNKAVPAPHLSGRHKIVLVPGPNASHDDLLASGWVANGPVYFRSMTAQEQIRFGPYRLAAETLNLQP